MTANAGDENLRLRPNWLRRRLAKWPVPLYRLGLGALLAQRVLMLTTRGRVTGRDRKTPLWYVRDSDIVYCMSGWGSSSDWLKNLEAYPQVLLQIGKSRWETRGALVHEPRDIERTLYRFRQKYGRLVPLFYHLDRLVLVSFPLQDGRRETRQMGS